MKKILLFGLAALTLITSACSNSKSEYDKERENAEINGKACLTEARTALSNEDFKSARAAIEKMRNEFRLAINAREEGILLMDSINLYEAEHDLKVVSNQLKEQPAKRDSLQVVFDDLLQKNKFYKRKLEHDKKNSKLK